MFKKPLNVFVFLWIMSTAILAISSKMIFWNIVVTKILYIIQVLLLLLFMLKLIHFLSNIFDIKNFIKNIKSLEKTNLYSAIAISSALISILFSINPISYLWDYNLYISITLWIIWILLWIIFVLVIPINLKFYSKIENVNWSWFIPPVWIFVIIISGSILWLKLWDFWNTMSLINLMLLGPAFVLYLLTLALVYFRSKFVWLNKSNIAPTFNIVLAPVAVSIIAMISTANLLNVNNFLWISSFFSDITKLYSLIFLWYGIWVFLSLMLLYIKIIKNHKKIPFSDIWRAFIFPIWAFSTAILNIKEFIVSNKFFDMLIYIIYILAIVAWIYMVYKKSLNIIKK